jgi:stress-induced morphogen
MTNYAAIDQQARQVLREAFGPEDIVIRADEGHYGKVYITLVSPYFDGKTGRDKQDEIWNVLRDKMGPDAQNIALVLALGADQI